MDIRAVNSFPGKDAPLFVDRKSDEPALPLDGISTQAATDGSLDATKKLAKLNIKTAEQILDNDNREISGRLYEIWSVKQSGNPRADTIYDATHKTLYTPMGNRNCPYLTALDQRGSIKWIYRDEEMAIDSSPAIDGEGNIYFRTDSGVVAIDPAGQKKWNFPVERHCGTGETPLAASPDGTVYVTTSGLTGEMTLYALREENGRVKVKWQFETKNNAHNRNPISLGRDGTVFLAAREEEEASPLGFIFGSPKNGNRYRIMALEPESGRIRYKVDVAQRMASKSFITQGNDGTTYVSHGVGYNSNMKVDEHNRLTAFSKRGREKWSYDVPQLPCVKDSLDRVYLNQAPCIDNEGNIYMATGGTYDYPEGYLVCLDSKGNERWRKTVRDDTFATRPAIGPDGNIYAGSDKGMLFIYDRDGNLKNKIQAGRMLDNNFSFGDNGEVYLNVEGSVKAIQPDVGKLPEGQLEKAVESPAGQNDEPSIDLSDEFVIIGGLKLPRKDK